MRDAHSRGNRSPQQRAPGSHEREDSSPSIIQLAGPAGLILPSHGLTRVDLRSLNYGISVIDLQLNRIRALPKEFLRLTNLKELNLK